MSVRQGFVVTSAVLLLLISAWTAYWSPAAWLFIPVKWKVTWDRADANSW